MTAERSAALLEQLVSLRQEAEASPERRQRLLAWADRIAAELGSGGPRECTAKQLPAASVASLIED